MGAKQENLIELLKASGFPIQRSSRPRLTFAAFKRVGIGDEVLRIYRALDGQENVPKCATGNWDACGTNCAVELDEELHFNRYRAITLESPFSSYVGERPTVRIAIWDEVEVLGAKVAVKKILRSRDNAGFVSEAGHRLRELIESRHALT